MDFFVGTGTANGTTNRITHAAGLGGISFSAMLAGTYEACSVEQLDACRFGDQTPPRQQRGVRH